MRKTDSEKKLNIKFYMTPIRFSSAHQKSPKYTRTINHKSKPITADNLIYLYSLKSFVESCSLSTISFTLTTKKKRKVEGNHQCGIFFTDGRLKGRHKDIEGLQTH